MGARGLHANPGVFVILCDYAAIAKDGTISMVRGGIDRFSGPLPVAVMGTLLIQVEGGVLPPGTHAAVVQLADTAGSIVFEATGSIEIKSTDDGSGGVRATIPVAGLFERYGDAALRVEIAGTLVATLNLSAEGP